MVRSYARTVGNFFFENKIPHRNFLFRLAALETTVENKDQQYAELNQKYNRLSEDFKYNLKLIDDRDKELATFDHRLKGLDFKI